MKEALDREIIISNRNRRQILNFHTDREKLYTIKCNEEDKKTVSGFPIIDNSEIEYDNKRYDIYLWIVKVISMTIEFCLCIAFIVVESVIKEKEPDLTSHYSGVAWISAFFFIFFILFVVEVLLICFYKKKEYSYIAIIFFWFSQLFYFIGLFMIPSHYSRVIYANENEINEVSDIKKRYKMLIIFSQIFNLFIIFLDFIIINLYKDLCCDMDEICNNTIGFVDNLCICIKDIISRVICQSKNEEDEEIKKIVIKSEEQKEEMNNLNEEIKNLLSKHIDLLAKSQFN